MNVSLPQATGVVQFLKFALALGLAAWLFRVFVWTSHQPKFDDYEVFHEAASLTASGQSAYIAQPGWPAGHRFKYSPAAAQLYASTIAGTDVVVSGWVHYIVTAIGWLAVVMTVGIRLGLARKRVIVLFILFFAIALRDELKMGQANLWAISGLVLGMLA